MRIYNISQLRCIFRDYNRDYFNGILPMPDFRISHSFRYFGYFYSDICNNTTVNPIIEISDCWEYTEPQLRNIFVHEMVHYYLAYTGKDIVGSHGKEFYDMAYELNCKYGLGITERINTNRFVRREGTSKIKYWLSQLF